MNVSGGQEEAVRLLQAGSGNRNNTEQWNRVADRMASSFLQLSSALLGASPPRKLFYFRYERHYRPFITEGKNGLHCSTFSPLLFSLSKRHKLKKETKQGRRRKSYS